MKRSRRARAGGIVVTAGLLLTMVAGCNGSGLVERTAGAAGEQDATNSRTVAPAEGHDPVDVDLTAAESDDANLHPDRTAEEMAADSGGSVPESTDPASSEIEGDAEADVTVEVGERNPAGAYVEDEDALAAQPAADASTVGVLCNLNAEYIGGLAALTQEEDGLNTSFVALSLSDHIQVWEMLVGEYPDARDDVDRAKRILNLWHEAMVYEDEGLQAQAEDAYRRAEAEIADLSSVDAVAEEAGCL